MENKVNKKQQQCKYCGKRVVQLSRHMHQQHNIGWCIEEPSDIRQFIHLLQKFPLPIKLWAEIMENDEKELIRYEKGDTMCLPSNLHEVIYGYFDKYQHSDTKLVLTNKVVYKDGTIKYQSTN